MIGGFAVSAKRVMLIKRSDGLFEPATDCDALENLKVGEGCYVQRAKVNHRSVKHHRLFFGGLLTLAYDYWHLSGGVVSMSERDVVRWVVKDLCRQSGSNEQILLSYAEQSCDRLANLRAEKLGTIKRDINAFLDWLKVEAGHFDEVVTPCGLVRRPKSISFANMNQDEFMAFYRSCFDVVWNLFLQNKFKDEEEAQAAIEELLLLGA